MRNLYSIFILQDLARDAKHHQLKAKVHLINYMEHFILKGFFMKVFLMIPGSNDLMLPLANYLNKVKSSQPLRVKEIDPNNFKDKSIPRDLRDTIIKKCFQ